MHRIYIICYLVIYLYTNLCTYFSIFFVVLFVVPQAWINVVKWIDSLCNVMASDVTAKHAFFLTSISLYKSLSCVIYLRYRFIGVHLNNIALIGNPLHLNNATFEASKYYVCVLNHITLRPSRQMALCSYSGPTFNSSTAALIHCFQHGSWHTPTLNPWTSLPSMSIILRLLLEMLQVKPLVIIHLTKMKYPSMSLWS